VILFAEMLTADSPWAHVKLDGWQVTASSSHFKSSNSNVIALQIIFHVANTDDLPRIPATASLPCRNFIEQYAVAVLLAACDGI
jgi:hypothetical protein